MSMRIMSRVWEHSQQSGTHLLVLLALADVANDYGVSWYSRQKLASRARTTPRNIAKILARLEADGEAVRVNRPGTSNYYVVTVGMSDADRAEVVAEFDDISHDDLAPKGCPNGQGGGEQMDTPTRERTDTPGGVQMDKGGVNARTGGGERADRGGVNARTPDPLMIPHYPEEEPTERTARATAVIHPADFSGMETADPAQALFEEAEKLVSRWRAKRGQHGRLSLDDPDHRADYYAPAMQLIQEIGGRDAAWRAIDAAYNEMLRAGYTPQRLAPVVSRALADLERSQLPPAPVAMTAANGQPYDMAFLEQYAQEVTAP